MVAKTLGYLCISCLHAVQTRAPFLLMDDPRPAPLDVDYVAATAYQ
jgi:hypothetical protein